MLGIISTAILASFHAVSPGLVRAEQESAPSTIPEPRSRVFGSALAPTVDIDGDGVPDLLVSDVCANTNGPRSGRVWAISCKTSQPLWFIDGKEEKLEFGSRITVLGPGKHDSRPSQAGIMNLTGAIQWCDSKDGHMSRVQPIKSASLEGGRKGLLECPSWDCSADYNDDGMPDVVIAEVVKSSPNGARAVVRVLSGLDGRDLSKPWAGENRSYEYMRAYSCPDVDGDGVPEIIVLGVRRDKDSSEVAVVSGRSGAIVTTQELGTGLGGTIGVCAVIRGEKGQIVLATSSNAADGKGGVGAGSPGVELVDVRAHDVLRILRPPDAYAENMERDGTDVFGSRMIAINDIDGDGWDDLCVSQPDAMHGMGAAFTYSGRSGKLIWTLFYGEEMWSLGYALCQVSDLDGDGVADLAVSACTPNTVGFGGQVMCVSGKTGAELRRIRVK